MRKPTVPLLLPEQSYSWSTDGYAQPGTQAELRKGAHALGFTLCFTTLVQPLKGEKYV